MTITELIAALEAARAEHGDLPVFSNYCGHVGQPGLEVCEIDWEEGYEPWIPDEERKYYAYIAGTEVVA